MGLFKPKWETSNFDKIDKAVAEVNKISDESQLEDIVMRAPLLDVCICAVKKITDQERLLRIYHKMCGKSFIKFTDAVLDNITDQNILVDLIMGEDSGIRTDITTKHIIAHISDPVLLKQIALYASDRNMTDINGNPFEAHYNGGKWSKTQDLATERISDYDIMAEILLSNGYRNHFKLFKNCPEKEKYYQLFIDEGDADLKSASLAELVLISDNPEQKLYYAARINGRTHDLASMSYLLYKLSQTCDLKDLLLKTKDEEIQKAFADSESSFHIFGDEFLLIFYNDETRDPQARQKIGEYLLQKDPEKFTQLITEEYINRLLENVYFDIAKKIPSLETLRMLSSRGLIVDNCREEVDGLIWNEAKLNTLGIIHYIEGSTDIWTLGERY